MRKKKGETREKMRKGDAGMADVESNEEERNKRSKLEKNIQNKYNN